MIKNAIVLLFAYLIGSISNAIIICKIHGVDIKKVGSGNAGATNTVRALGKKQGVTVFLLDFFKGFIACLIGGLVSKEIGVLCGLIAILGHIFPLYFKFKGGKGVSTTFGVLLYLDYRIALIIGAIVLILILSTKIVSLSVLISFIILPVATYFINGKNNLYITCAITVLIFFTHRQNIVRLAHGEENRFSKK